jgi:hypothetical protein
MMKKRQIQLAGVGDTALGAIAQYYARMLTRRLREPAEFHDTS